MTGREGDHTMRGLRHGLLMLLLAAAAGPARLPACSFPELPEITDETFFQPEIIASPADVPLFLTPHHRFYGPSPHAWRDVNAVNLDEWNAFFRGELSFEAWSQLLYRDDLTRVEGLILLLEGRPGAPRQADDDPFLTYPHR
jgi:hypothetical protein